MLNTVQAALQMIGRRGSVFERTPKFGILQQPRDWLRQRYHPRLDPIVFAELAFAVFNLGTCLFAVQTRNWAVAVYAALFCSGLLFTAGMTLVQALAVHWSRAATPLPVT